MNMKRWMMFLLFLLVLPTVGAQFYDYRVATGYLGVLNFAEIYGNYAVYIDSIIYLLIFLGLGNAVFGAAAKNEPEKEKAYKLIYIGLALALTIGMLLAESRMGFSLLEKLGPFTGFILFILLAAGTYNITSFMIENKWLKIGITILLSLMLFDSFYTYFNGQEVVGSYVGSFISSGDHRLLYLLAGLALIVGAIKSGRLKATGSEGGESSGELPRPPQPDVPPEVAADLQTQRNALVNYQDREKAYVGIIEEIQFKTQEAIKAGKQAAAQKLKQQAEEYNARLKALEEERVTFAKKIIRRYLDKKKDLNVQIQKLFEEQRNLRKELDAVKASSKATTDPEITKLKEDLERRNRELEGQIAALQAQMKAITEATQRAEKEEAEALEKFKPLATTLAAKLEKGEIPVISLEETGKIMRPKPEPLLIEHKRVIESGPVIELPERLEGVFTESQIEEALRAEAGQTNTTSLQPIQTYIKKSKIEAMLREVAKRRDFFEDIERETFLLRLFTKKSIPQSNLLHEEFLNNLQITMDKLIIAAGRYIKWYPNGRYSNLVTEFLTTCQKERMKYQEVQSYKKVRKEVLSIIRFIGNRYPEIVERIRKRLRKPTDIDLTIRPFIDDDVNLNAKDKQLLHEKVDALQKTMVGYSKTLSEFFNELHNYKVIAEKILNLKE